MPTIKPLNDYILLKRIEKQESSSGIVVPETILKEESLYGEVIAVGPGKKTENGTVIPMSVKVGDKIVISRFSFTEVDISGEKFVYASEEDVIAIVE